MIPYEVREAIRVMKQQGSSIREIGRVLKVSRNAVRRVLRHPEPTEPRHSPRQTHITEKLPELYKRCKGNAVRIGEVLTEEYEIDVPYSTLTRLLREEDLRAAKKRSGSYEFEPGEETQHDTSPHRLELGGQIITAQCAGLVLAYSRKLFFQYYPAFTRFEAKVFLTEAFRFFEGTCPKCIIDNTAVFVVSGSGPDAIIAPEMEAFGKLFEVRFIPHAIRNPNRKGRIERPFHFIENNFLAARTFKDWDDLNRQARTWCEQYAGERRNSRLAMSPNAAYIIEKPSLQPLPSHIPTVTQIHYRVVDTQGYVHLDTNRYSAPERLVGKQVAVHKCLAQVLIFCDHVLVAQHPRLVGKRHARHLIKAHHADLTRGRPAKGPSPQEQMLKGKNDMLDRYVDALKKGSPGRGVTKLRKLLELQRAYPPDPFLKAIEQALKYKMLDLSRLERLILDNVVGDFFNLGDEI